jgi:hypothetical protein
MLADLNGNVEFTPDELQQAKQLIQQMRQLRIARCNHQPDLHIPTHGDRSITFMPIT